MATRLHQYFRISINTTSTNSGNVANSNNAKVPPQDTGSQQQQSMETSVPHGNSPISQQFTYQLSNLLRQFMPLVNSQPVDVSSQSPLTSNQPPNTNRDEELSEVSIIQPVTPVTTSGAVTHHTSNALSMPINQSPLMNTIPTSVANPIDQLLPPVPPRIRE